MTEDFAARLVMQAERLGVAVDDLPWRIFGCPRCGENHYNDESCARHRNAVPLSIRPLSLREANELVSELHRHHAPVQGHRFSMGAYSREDDEPVGAVIVGRPVSRHTDHGQVAEVTRLVTDGTPNACSVLYGAAARAAKALGFAAIQTFTLPDEGGGSLRGAGWKFVGTTRGGSWSRAGRVRRRDQPEGPKLKWVKMFRRAG